MTVEAGGLIHEYTPSQGQLRFWLLDRLMPLPHAYNLAFSCHVRGVVDPTAFRDAALALADRHDAMRTTFAEGDSGPVAQVRSFLPPFVRVVEAQAWDASSLDGALERFRQEPFSLETGSPLRIGLFRVGPAASILLLVVHHIASDFPSIEILLEDLERLYQTALQTPAAAEASPAPPAPPFEDFANLEAAQNLDRAAQASEDYWKTQLSGAPPPLTWPYRSRASSSAHYFFAMDDALVASVKRYAQELRVTPSAVLLAAWGLLLAEVTGERDCVVGVPMSTRNAKFAQTVGCFINTLPIRIAATEDADFRTLTLRAWEALVGAVRHRRYPLNQIVREANVAREAGRNPLFQTMLILQRPRRADALGVLHVATEARELEVPWAGLVLTPRRLEQQEGQVDLSLEANDTEGLFQCVFKAETERVPADELPGLAKRLQVILAQGLAR